MNDIKKLYELVDLASYLDAKASNDLGYRITVLSIGHRSFKVNITHTWQAGTRSTTFGGWIPFDQHGIDSIIRTMHQDIDDILASIPKHLK